MDVEIEELRKNYGECDRKRDEGLTTPEDIVRYDDIAYGTCGRWNLLDIYHQKKVVCKQPVIVSVHGGAWVYGEKEIYQYYCMSLAQKGFTVVNFNYRLAPEYQYPAALEDINQVFWFLKERGADYFADVQRLFVVGDSAGAQLASQYLTILTNPSYAKLFPFLIPEIQVRAAALNCGLYDVGKCGKYQLDMQYRKYVGEAVGAGVGLTDALRYMTRDFPPSFIMSACNDFLLGEAEPMHRHLTGLGVDNLLRIYGDSKAAEIAHVFHVNIKLAEAQRCNEEECQFFNRYMTA